MTRLPEWEEGTPGVLCAAGPHPIPVTSVVRDGDRRVLVALAGGRETLARLREDPAAAFCLLGRGAAFTAHGRVSVLSERLEAAPGVAALELRVERVQDHLADGRTEMLDGARWRWTDDRWTAAERDVLLELRRLADSTR
jgi:hypothetical protein